MPIFTRCIFDFGTALHYAIEHTFNADPAKNVDDPIKLFKDEFRKLFDENSSKYSSDAQRKKYVTLVHAGERIIENIKKCPQLVNATILANEFFLYEPIAGVDKYFKGFVDLVLVTKNALGEEKIFTVDIKSSFSEWDTDKVQDNDSLLQVRLYKAFISKKLNIPLSDGACAYLFAQKDVKSGNKVTWREVDSSSKALLEALKDLYKTLDQMSSGVYSRNRLGCYQYGEFCSFFETDKCPTDDLTSEQLVQLKVKK